jgi:arylsulfatase A-like enzyme
MKKNTLRVLGLTLTAGLVAAGPTRAEEKPNFIVVFVDDMGWADLGIHGTAPDAKTPHLDQLARDGALFSDGYITAPQCAPSRAGLMTGLYQQRFGFDSIADCPLPLEQVTLADRLKAAGYTTGMVGKWHLEPLGVSVKWAREQGLLVEGRVELTEDTVFKFDPGARGFDRYFKGNINRYRINYDLDGQPVEAQWFETEDYRVDVQTKAAQAFIANHGGQPFFLYLAYYAPHVPLVATAEYLARFPGEMPERRRTALAMISAIDDGIGAIRRQLEELGIEKNTVIFFLSDNGAALKIDMKDLPLSTMGGSWCGSLNTPWVGEKGMLMEGGIRTPFLAAWPGTIPGGQVFADPVIALDVAPTMLAMAGLPPDPKLDGVSLLPLLTGQTAALDERDLFWRFWQQGAIRRGPWKYLVLADGRERLFNLSTERHENEDLLEENPTVAAELREAWHRWAADLQPAGLTKRQLNEQEKDWYAHYFAASPGETDAPTDVSALPGKFRAMDTDGNGQLSREEYIEGRAAKENTPPAARTIYDRKFRELDTDGDGYLNATELQVR